MTLIYEEMIQEIAFGMDTHYLNSYDQKDVKAIKNTDERIKTIRDKIKMLFDSYRPQDYDVRGHKFILIFQDMIEAKQFSFDIKALSICYKEITLSKEIGHVVRMTGRLPFDHVFRHQAFPA